MESESAPLSHLSLREKIAQLVFVRIGSNLRPPRIVEEDEEQVAKFLQQYPVGGLVLFNGGPRTKETLARLQSMVKTPLLVGSDVERGVGQQARGYTLLPHLMAFGQLGDEAVEVVRDFARCVAAEARDVGIHVAFSPVADVASNPRNPIISTRAFGEDPQRVAELTRAFVEAAEAAGLCSTAKHFPGHGDTARDSHDSQPIVDVSREVLERRELVPFQAAIDAGCSLVMTAHVAYPALDPSGTPATFSRKILHEHLRGRMGFQGVVCSDSLLMAGARGESVSEGETALSAINAGVDILLDLEQPGHVIDYLVQCAENGKLEHATVDAAYDRVRALKQHVFGAERSKSGVTPVGEFAKNPDSAGKKLNSGESSYEELASADLPNHVASGAITVLGDTSACLPFDKAKPMVCILFKPHETHLDPPEQPLGDALRRRFHDTTYIQLGPTADDSARDQARHAALAAKQLLVAIVVRPAAWHAFGLLPWQRELVDQILGARRDVVLASLGVPYVLNDYPDAAVRVCTYSDVPVSQEALASSLVGERC
jgi:beta-glucosidase-like glycosyl hydrolase